MTQVKTETYMEMVFHDESLVKTTSQVSSPGVLLHLPSELVCCGTLVSLKTRHFTGHLQHACMLCADACAVTVFVGGELQLGGLLILGVNSIDG